MPKPREPLLTTQEVADWLQIAVGTVIRYGDEGILPFYQIGPRRLRRYRLSDVERLLADRAAS